MLHVRNLASGSSGNSTLIWTENARILVDAGLSALQIRRRVEDTGFEMGDIDAIIISHEHGDHIKGIEVLSRRYGITVYANEGTWLGINDSKHIKKGVENRGILRDEMQFGDLKVESFPVPHDAIDPVGFIVKHNGDEAVLVTDIGHPTSYLTKAMKRASLIVVESNHDVEMVKNGPYPYYLKQRILGPEGHLSNEDCGKAIFEAMNEDLGAVMLAHISENNNTPELAERTVREYIGEEMNIVLTGREPGPIMDL
jgi:phosphoribosyl 1,2-cyclic phosphodiesterase